MPTTHCDPFLLRPDNFTPAERTPWGGVHIVDQIKRGLLGADWHGHVVGESWELSAGDELPSVDLQGRRLRDRISEQPFAMLGAEAQHGATTTSLLVKLLDASDDLSVQIHPFDDDPALGLDETGKSEAWLVVRAEPGATIYLGLRSDVTEAMMRDTLNNAGDASTLLRAWKVAAGDFFVVEPGMPHAIGRGITLVEPQTATAGKRAMTYRYWDWNRRYDARGQLDPSGKPRELHVERALAVTRWSNTDAEDRHVTRLGAANLDGPAVWQPMCGPVDAPCASNALRVGRLTGTGLAKVPSWNVLRALTVIEGNVDLVWPRGNLRVVAGQTAVLPASANDLNSELDHAHAVLSGSAATSHHA